MILTIIIYYVLSLLGVLSLGLKSITPKQGILLYAILVLVPPLNLFTVTLGLQRVLNFIVVTFDLVFTIVEVISAVLGQYMVVPFTRVFMALLRK